jgi:hypothetical protein
MVIKEQGLKMAIGEMTDFFRKEAQECRRLAAQATAKNDQEYWSRLAHGWEWLLQQNSGTKTAQQTWAVSIRKTICKAAGCLAKKGSTGRRSRPTDWF